MSSVSLGVSGKTEKDKSEWRIVKSDGLTCYLLFCVFGVHFGADRDFNFWAG